jgi:hypothetical protein
LQSWVSLPGKAGLGGWVWFLCFLVENNLLWPKFWTISRSESENLNPPNLRL